jgi:hypothetical protein
MAPLINIGATTSVWRSPAINVTVSECPIGASDGGSLVELHRDWAVIDLPVNRSQRIFYRRNVDPAKITLPWLKQVSLR